MKLLTEIWMNQRGCLDVLLETQTSLGEIGHKIEKIWVDGIILHGVIPLQKIRGNFKHNIFHCCVDYVEIKDKVAI